jgi:hypothetical protein
VRKRLAAEIGSPFHRRRVPTPDDRRTTRIVDVGLSREEMTKSTVKQN